MTAGFLFSSFPYIALVVLVAGMLVRTMMARGRMEAVAGESREAVEMLCSGKAWCASLLVLLVLHLAGLVFPSVILEWSGNTARLYLLEGVAFAVGAVALGSWAVVMWRNLKRSGGSTITEVSDTIFLALLLMGVLSGLLMAAVDRWGSIWGAMILTPYMLSLLRGRPETQLVTGMPFLVRLHVFSVFAVLAVLPGTRLASVLVLGLHRSFAMLGRPLTAAGRFVDEWMQKHNPAGRIWPEED